MTKLIYFIFFILGINLASSAQVIVMPEYQVFIFLSDECLISQYYAQTLDSLHENYSSDKIEFLGVFPGAQITNKKIDNFKKEFDLDFMMIHDESQSITKRWKAKVTPEVIVVRLEDEEIIYQGRIDDAYFRVGKKRAVKTTSELRDVLFNLSRNLEIATVSKPAVGCFIQLL